MKIRSCLALIAISISICCHAMDHAGDSPYEYEQTLRWYSLVEAACDDQQGRSSAMEHNQDATSETQSHPFAGQADVTNTARVEAPVQLDYFTLITGYRYQYKPPHDRHSNSLLEIYASMLTSSAGRRVIITKENINEICNGVSNLESKLVQNLLDLTKPEFASSAEHSKGARELIRHHYLNAQWMVLDSHAEVWYTFFSNKGKIVFTENEKTSELRTIGLCFLIYIDIINHFVLRQDDEVGIGTETFDLTSAYTLLWRMYRREFPITDNFSQRCPNFPTNSKCQSIKHRMSTRILDKDKLTTVWNFLEVWMAQCRPKLLETIREVDEYNIKRNVKIFFNYMFASLITPLTQVLIPRQYTPVSP